MNSLKICRSQTFFVEVGEKKLKFNTFLYKYTFALHAHRTCIISTLFTTQSTKI